MAKAFQRTAFQNDTDHSNKAFQVGAAAVFVYPQAHLGVLRGLPPQYADLNTPLRGLGVEYEPVGGQQYVSLPPQHRGL